MYCRKMKREIEMIDRSEEIFTTHRCKDCIYGDYLRRDKTWVCSIGIKNETKCEENFEENDDATEDNRNNIIVEMFCKIRRTFCALRNAWQIEKNIRKKLEEAYGESYWKRFCKHPIRFCKIRVKQKLKRCQVDGCWDEATEYGMFCKRHFDKLGRME